jgi:hypothetical protein
MSRQEVKDQAARLKRPGATVRCVDDGETVVVIVEKYTPPNADAYTPSELEALAFVVPVTFPDASPDPTGFFVRPVGIMVGASRTHPQSTGETTLVGQHWRKFSWKPQTFGWDPAIDTLDTHLATIENRFRRGT